MQTGASDFCRSVLFICGWIAFLAAAIVLALTVFQSRVIDGVAEGIVLTFAGVVSGALLHAAAFALGWLEAIELRGRQVESQLVRVRDAIEAQRK